MPKWDVEDKALGDIKVHISSTGTIEDALGFLQVDFANKYANNNSGFHNVLF